MLSYAGDAQFLPSSLPADVVKAILAKRANGGVTPDGYRNHLPRPSASAAADSTAAAEAEAAEAAAKRGSRAPKPPAGGRAAGKKPSPRVAKQHAHPGQYIGESAQQEFFGMYHDFHSGRGIAESINVERPRSPRSTYLRKCEELGLVPEPMGVVRKQYSQTISLGHMCMGDAVAEAVSESFEMLPWASSLDLSHNRLREHGGKAIVGNLGEWVQQLDLSHNLIGYGSCTVMREVLQHHTCALTDLNLEANRLGDRAVACIAEGLESNDCLRRLNLSSNNIGDVGAEAIGRALGRNSALVELVLSWNVIRERGVAAIAETLSYNSSLQDFDLSYSMGSHAADSQVASKLGEALEINTALLHLNLAYNHLDARMCMTLADHLRNNNTLMGLHMEGNDAYVDTLGQICALEDDDEDGEAVPVGAPVIDLTSVAMSLVSRGGTSTSSGSSESACASSSNAQCSPRSPRKNSSISKSTYLTEAHVAPRRDTAGKGWISTPGVLNGIDVEPQAEGARRCWLCGGWSEMEFHWTPGHSDGNGNAGSAAGGAGGGSGRFRQPKKVSDTQVWLRLECDGWQPTPMIKDPQASSSFSSEQFFVAWRVVPPGPCRYVFTTREGHSIATTQAAIDQDVSDEPVYFPASPLPETTVPEDGDHAIRDADKPADESSKKFRKPGYSVPKVGGAAAAATASSSPASPATPAIPAAPTRVEPQGQHIRVNVVPVELREHCLAPVVAVPRPPIDFDSSKIHGPKWTARRSIFVGREQDSANKSFYATKVLFARCAAADLLCGKLWRYFPAADDRREIMTAITAHYGALFYAFKYYSALNSGGIFGIQKNEYRSLLQDAGLVTRGDDGTTEEAATGPPPSKQRQSVSKESGPRRISMVDLDNLFISVNIGASVDEGGGMDQADQDPLLDTLNASEAQNIVRHKQANEDNTIRSLVRYEFIEIIVRLALLKYEARPKVRPPKYKNKTMVVRGGGAKDDVDALPPSKPAAASGATAAAAATGASAAPTRAVSVHDMLVEFLGEGMFAKGSKVVCPDADAFRRTHLYAERIDLEFRKHILVSSSVTHVAWGKM
jgi:hypothetical protein